MFRPVGAAPEEILHGASVVVWCSSSRGRHLRPADIGFPREGRGNAVRRILSSCRAPSLSGVRPGCGVWSRKSSAKSSSNTSKFPPPCTYSVFRRTTAFAASLVLLIVMAWCHTRTTARHREVSQYDSETRFAAWRSTGVNGSAPKSRVVRMRSSWRGATGRLCSSLQRTLTFLRAVTSLHPSSPA